jgi:hypothetical protein
VRSPPRRAQRALGGGGVRRAVVGAAGYGGDLVRRADGRRQRPGAGRLGTNPGPGPAAAAPPGRLPPTPPADADRFKALLTGAPRVDIVTLDGGGPASISADPCIDDKAVAPTVQWLATNRGTR